MITQIKATLFLICFSVSYEFTAFSKEYTVTSAAGLTELNLIAGDKVILQKGEWLNQKLVFKGQGTKESPIVLTGSLDGGLILKGNSSLTIDGSWLVVEGLNFSEGALEKGSVVSFSNTSENCRLTHSAIINYNPVAKETNYVWVSLRGFNNRVDHCYFEGKTHLGCTLAVDVSDKPNFHSIDHNYFGPRPVLGMNGGESIRVGNSKMSLHDSKTTVEQNIFQHCNGEAEIITNKSCKNIIRNNLFYESQGTLTLRHGNDARVYGNYFIGNGIRNTGGVRVIGENHLVYNNYFHALTGTGLRAAISIMNAGENPPLHGYWPVKNVRIVANTIINCAEPFVIGSGKNKTTFVPPVTTSIANNLIVSSGILIKVEESKSDIRIEGNLVEGTVSNQYSGFSNGNLRLKVNSMGIMEPADKSDAIGAFKGTYDFISSKNAGTLPATQQQQALFKAKDIGPKWLNLSKRIQIKSII